MPTAARSFLHRHERRLIVAWLAGCALVLAVVGGWGVAGQGADRAIRFMDRRWSVRLDRAQELVDAGQYERAVGPLERLDRDLPATWIKHHRSYERERLLSLLGTTYAALGKKRKALDAYQRLADFDPRNWWNTFQLAGACRLLGEDERARDAFDAVLALHPAHLRSVEARIEQEFEAGRHGNVPPLYEAYLDAWLFSPGELRLGDVALPLEIPVDGRAHVLEIPLPAGAGGELCLATGGYSLRVDDLVIVPALRVGETRAAEPLHLDANEDWSASGFAREGSGAWSAAALDAALCRPVAADGVGRLRLTVRAFKPLSPELWGMVAESYANVLDTDGLRRARERSVVGGVPHGDVRYLHTFSPGASTP